MYEFSFHRSDFQCYHHLTNQRVQTYNLKVLKLDSTKQQILSNLVRDATGINGSVTGNMFHQSVTDGVHWSVENSCAKHHALQNS